MKVRLHDSCANLDCPNKPGEGAFFLASIGEGNVVGGHRALRFLLCSPCAKALDEQMRK